MKKEIAIFAAGCFWHVEEVFIKTSGVISTRVGYTGGNTNNPSYNEVCTGKTGYAESIEITYDPKKISYNVLLEIFWRIHNPTTLNRQGADIGTNYRSAIFYLNDKQKEIAIKSKEEIQRKFNKLVVTEITKASQFYPAEEYHQKYFQKHEKSNCLI